MNICFLKNLPKQCFRMDDWTSAISPLLLLTGLSGSGKTFAAQELADYYNIPWISFDVLKFHDQANSDSRKVLNLFLEKHTKIKSLVDCHWSKTDINYSNDILYNYYCNLFFDFIYDYALEIHKSFILEGIQIFVRLHPSKTVRFPLIVMGSSSLQSFRYKYKRDYLSKNPLQSFMLLPSDFYLYHVQQRKILNNYICYYETIIASEKNTINMEGIL